MLGTKEGRKGENGNSRIKFWVTIGGGSERSISSPTTPRCNSRGRFAFCVHPRPSSRHAFSYYYRIQIGDSSDGDSRPRFVADLFRRGASTKSRRRESQIRNRTVCRSFPTSASRIESRPCDYFPRLRLEYVARWKITHSSLSLSLSLMIFFRFLGFIDDSKFDPISGWMMVLEWWRWLVFLDTMFVSKLVFYCCYCCCCNWKWNGIINIWEM